MKPLSQKQRRLYRWSIIIIFIVVAPFLILYATGYRLVYRGLERVGGLAISTTVSGADLYLNNQLAGQNYFFRKNFFIDNLTPGAYSIVVSRPGYFPWYKNLSVNVGQVTQAFAYLAPQKPTFREITRFQPASKTVTGAPNGMTETSEYSAAAALFATTTSNILLERNTYLNSYSGHVWVNWQGDIKNAPEYFCDTDCFQALDIFHDDSGLLNYSFLPGYDAVVLVSTKGSGVSLVEVDGRGRRNIWPIYAVPLADFRIRADDHIIIKDGSTFYDAAL